MAFVSSRKGKATRAITAVLDESPKQPSKPKSNAPRELVDGAASTSKPQQKKRSREENNVAPNVLVERKAKATNDDQPLGKTALSECTKRRLRFEDELPQEAFDTSNSVHLQVEFVEIEGKSNEHKCHVLQEQPYNCENGIAGALGQVISVPIGQPSSKAEQAEQQVTSTASTSPMLVLAASTYKEAPNNPPALQIEEAEIYEQIILDGSSRSNHSTVAEVGNLQVVEQSTQCHQHFGSKRLDKVEIATNLESMDDEALAGLFDLWVERGYLKEIAVDGAVGKNWFRAHYPSLHAVYPQSPISLRTNCLLRLLELKLLPFRVACLKGNCLISFMD